jgi:hypothetical protein
MGLVGTRPPHPKKPLGVIFTSIKQTTRKKTGITILVVSVVTCLLNALGYFYEK